MLIPALAYNSDVTHPKAKTSYLSLIHQLIIKPLKRVRRNSPPNHEPHITPLMGDCME